MRAWLIPIAIAVLMAGCGSSGGANGGGGQVGTGGSASGSGGQPGSGGVAAGGSSGTGGVGTGGGGTGGRSGSGGAGIGGAGIGGAGIGSGGFASGGNAGTMGSTGGAAGGAGKTGSGGVAGNGGRVGSGGKGGKGGGGIAGAGGGGGTNATICGGRTGRACAATEYCDFPDGSCGAADQTGVCAPRFVGGVACLTVVVCGCDGQTYSSPCSAHQNGVDTTATTSCIPGNGGMGAPCAADTDCATGFKCCREGGAVSSPISCLQVAAGSQCPLLP